MVSDIKGARPRYALLSLLVIFVIAYGSLYPFIFHASRVELNPFRVLISTWRILDAPGDTILNILLYVPLGFFGVQALSGVGSAWPTIPRILLATLTGLALSTGIELAQLYDVGRVTGMGDVYANTTGTLLGALAGLSGASFPTLLALCWLGSRLYPYVPVFDARKYSMALARLAHPFPFSTLDFYGYIAAWLAFALLLEAVFGPDKASMAVPVLLLVSLGARVVIAQAVLAPEEVMGAVAALVLWLPLLSRLPGRVQIVSAIFLSWVILQSLAPFQFEWRDRSFGWIPFLSLINSPTETAAYVFLQKSFMYGALVWLAVRSGFTWTVATSLGFGLIFCLRMFQVYLPGRSAEITDAFIYLMLAIVMKLMGTADQRR